MAVGRAEFRMARSRTSDDSGLGSAARAETRSIVSGAPATGNTPGGTAVTLAAQPLYLSTEAASVITPDRAPAARRSLTVRFALSSDGPAEQIFGGPQAALR